MKGFSWSRTLSLKLLRNAFFKTNNIQKVFFAQEAAVKVIINN